MNAYIRTKLALTEPNPTIRPYDQAAFAELPDTKSAPIANSLLLLRALHVRWVSVLEALTDDQWMRTYQHPDSGEYTLERMAESYAEHGENHLDQIRRALAAKRGA